MSNADFLKKRLKKIGVPENRITNNPDFVYDDGGMYEAGEGFVDPTNKRLLVGNVYMEEVCDFDHIRAIAIASGMGWKEVRKKYKDFYDQTKVRTYARIVKEFIEDELGWRWTPIMGIGTGVTMHCRKGELPKGHLILRCSKYYMASIHGIIHDAFDNTREGARAVYGYWETSFFTPENYKLITGELL